jgi:hypothetical protein
MNGYSQYIPFLFWGFMTKGERRMIDLCKT